ncbi:MgtC/SapB family protein [Roseibium salinum]|uniref:Protein MgtC n=1 Tax=Roseibium salinum TaxID=1604349 RepID=A0ABT3R7W0_9HYPH|nr:MgtC/SapB family protein [Roseibium sp. DSM 29163]MCX2725191.1 MgtC/SapB family protein [Roseibium sp. DSM 29163]
MFEDIYSEFSIDLTALPVHIALLRMFAAILLGGVIGFEREGRGKDAGLRTHMLIAFAACIFLIVGQEIGHLPFSEGEQKRVDPLRLVEAVTAGVAFLAAGLIFARGGTVVNVTTGASMWLAGAIGMACGAGELGLAAVATVLVLIVLTIVGVLENRFTRKKSE